MPAMKYRLTAAAAASALLIAVSGCGSEDGGGASDTATSESIPTATTEQYASLIAQNGIDDDLKGFNSECLSPFGLCLLKPEPLGSLADSLVESLEEAPDTIGAPPAEIASLVDTTIREASALSEAATDASEACVASGDAEDPEDAEDPSSCDPAWTDLTTASLALSSTLDDWQPYL